MFNNIYNKLLKKINNLKKKNCNYSILLGFEPLISFILINIMRRCNRCTMRIFDKLHYYEIAFFQNLMCL